MKTPADNGEMITMTANRRLGNGFVRSCLLGSGLLLLSVVALAEGSAGDEQLPQIGDVANGKHLYRLHCAVCHGFDGAGAGPAAASLSSAAANHRDGGLMNARDDDMLRAVIMNGCRATGCAGPMPAFAGTMGVLDSWDLVAYLRTLHIPLRRFFSRMDEYVVKRYTIGGQGPQEFRRGQMERLKRILGRVDKADLSQVVFTLFRADRSLAVPRLVPQQPMKLAQLKKGNKVGYVLFMTLIDPRGRRVPVGLGMDKNYTITDLIPACLDAGLAQQLQKRLGRYVGLGKRGDRPDFKISRDKVGRKLDREVTRLYALAVEAANVYENEENERSWADGTF